MLIRAGSSPQRHQGELRTQESQHLHRSECTNMLHHHHHLRLGMLMRKKTEGSSGVIAMIDLLIKDLDKELTEAETEEKNSQADYETMMKESSAKRVADSKSL